MTPVQTHSGQAPGSAWGASSSDGTGGTDGSNGLALAGAGGDYLTLDGLIAYCEARMGGIDAQIRQIFEEQQQVNRDQAAINDALQAVTNYTGGGTQGDGDNKVVSTALQQAIQNVQDPAAKAKLIADFQLFQSEGGGNGGAVSATQMQSLASDLKSVGSDLGNGAELNMIQLQSLASQRGVAIQLATNLVQAVGDQMQKTVDNIGR